MSAVQALHFHARQPKTRLAKLGEWLRQHQAQIRALQWLIVLIYAALLIVPVFLPFPDETTHLWNNLTLAAQFAFWGIWWPFVILSMLLFGRMWCGVLCPEGALSEVASRYALGWPIPKWMRWQGWPLVAFAITTVYGQMVSVYQYPAPVLLILGGSTVAAIIIGLLYTREKRVWCRYLCPVSGVFGLLSKLAPLHYYADDHAWRASLGQRFPAVNCAPLLPLRHLDSNAACHSCGRCSSHRNAISLRGRSPNHEIIEHPFHTEPWQTALLLFGMIGLAMGAFEWSASPWLVSARQYLAQWLINRDIYWPLESNAPWWLLTHYPQLNDAFTWLDGGLLLAYIFAQMVMVGGLVWGGLSTAAKILGKGNTLHHLAQAMIPLAACGLFLGLSATTLSLLRSEHVSMAWVPGARAILLGGASLWSGWLIWQICGRYGQSWRRVLASSLGLACIALVDLGWALWFWIW